MAMGLDRNTPGYIWRIITGRNSIEIEARNRIYKDLGEMYEMSDKRQPQICLKGELRGIIKNNPLIWGESFSRVLNGSWMENGVGIEKIRDDFQKGVRTKRDQEIQEDD